VQHWSLNRTLSWAFGLLFALVVVASVGGWLAASAMKSRQDETVLAAQRLMLAGDVRAINAEIFGAEKNMILGGLTGNNELLQKWTSRLQALVDEGIRTSDDLGKAVRTEADRAEAGRLKQSMSAWGTRCDACHAIAMRGDLTKDIGKILELSAAGEALMARNQDLAAAIEKTQNTLFDDRTRQTAATFGRARLATIGMCALSVLVGAGIFVAVRGAGRKLRSATARLHAGASHVMAAASQVATSAQSLSQGATEQAASLEETSASMEEMASMTRKNAANATEAAGLVASVARQVTESNTALEGMVGSMAAIKESSNKVAKIIKTIDEIAFQTNILALNAAVEAARAGEAGMGFAVVADEVRNLAQRSAQAARDTAGLIEESIARSQEGAGKVQEVATAIGAITASVTTVKGIVEEVREASRQQTQGIDQVAQAIAQMEKVTQTTAATAEESAAASEELNAQAETTMAEITGLEALVGSTGASAAAPAWTTTGAAATTRPAPANVVKMTAKPGRPAKGGRPLADTGTYGKF
jgi:methyl-accepting chemotaxis protein/methyl-accepting chemotaxis protein-1 (serine sensor receptor)